ncbi:MAG: sigma-54 interaction domain-containing protein [Thermodesulfobacteriota bacterium]
MDLDLLGRNWKRILDTLRDGVVVVDVSGRVRLVNQAICRLTGFSEQELLDLPCTVFNCDACAVMRKPGSAHWCELFAGRLAENREQACTLIHKNGSCVPALKTASLLRDADGRVLGVVETVTDVSELERRDRKIGELSRQLAQEGGFMGMVGVSPAMNQVFDLIGKAALSDAPVMIYGESGTGKELAAKAIHDLSPRREGPYVVFNCAALSEPLFESELFGHVKGAFTGAHRHRRGRLEEADGGLLFMDEIGELSLTGQVKLLRVLESKSFERVGDQRPVQADVRFVAATNRDLRAMVAAGEFRHDLFFRLNVIPIFMPPLRQRPEDVPALVDHFLARLVKSTGKAITGASSQVMTRLMNHAWPGNVRELRTTLEYAFVVADQGRIEPRHLPPGLAPAADSAADAPKGRPDPAPPAQARPEGKPRDAELRQELLEALELCGGNLSQAARRLGVSRATVWNRMHRFGLVVRRVTADARDDVQ